MQKAIDGFRGRFDFDALSETIAINESKMAEPGFWDDQEAAQKLIDETNQLKSKRDDFMSLKNQLDDLKVTLELISEDSDSGMEGEFETNEQALKTQLDRYQLNLLLNGKYDHNNAIWKSTLGQVEPKLKIGHQCCCGCIPVGERPTVLKSKHWTIRSEMSRVSTVFQF